MSLIRSYANICSYMVICVLLPLLALRAALGDARNRLREPIALAPQHDGARLIGEVSPAAHALGVRPGMGLGEATDICPELDLITPDPTRTEAIHEAVLRRLEAIGAEVESEHPGEAFFAADEIERLYGGLDGVLTATRRQLGPNPLLAAAPTRLGAFAAARASDPDPVAIVSPEELPRFLATLPVTVLTGRLGIPATRERELLRSMNRLGLNRLGDLTALSRDDVADRLGPPGSRARDLALGNEGPIRARSPREQIAEEVDLPEAAAGTHLQGGLAILCDRLSARLVATGLTARSLMLEARLAGGGSWRRETSPRRPTASSQLMRMILAPALEQLPRPAESLRLRVTAPGPSAPEQLEITRRPEQTRRVRLDEAARQVRAAVGETGLMRVLDAEAGSRLPERRMLLTPYLSE